MNSSESAPPVEEQPAYESLQRRAIVLYLCFALVVASLLFSAWAGLEQVSLVEDLKQGQSLAPSDVAAAEDRFAISGLLYLLAFVATAVVFFMWIHRAARNLPALGVNHASFSPRQAIGWWFVPFVNLVRPFQIVKELMRESDRTEPEQGTLLGTWWGLWILSGVVGPGLGGLFGQSSDLDVLLLDFWRGVASDVLGVGAAVLAVLVVGLVTARQRKQAAARGIDESEWPPADEISDQLRPIGIPWSPILLVLAPVALALVWTLSAGLPSSGDGAVATGDGSVVAGEAVGELVDFDELKEGDCIADPITVENNLVFALRARVVPCSGPWAMIFLDRYVSTATGSFPGNSALQQEAAERCDLATTFLTVPSSDTWSAGDRSGLCFLESDGVFTPAPGECFWQSLDDQYVREAFVACETPHFAEIFFIAEGSDADPYLGQDTLDGLAELACLSAFEEYVGVTYQNSTLLVSWFVPTQAEWDLLDRRHVHCYLFREGPTLIEGSLAGSGE